MGVHPNVRAEGLVKVSDGRSLLLTTLYAIWVLAFGYAFYQFFTKTGWDASMGYRAWQLIAGMVALGVFGVSRAWPKGSSVRKLAVIPLIIGVAHLILLSPEWRFLGG